MAPVRLKHLHPEFVKYMQLIAEHPNYAGMPDLQGASGEIQWETPSNRASGRFKDSHAKRLQWWREKAGELRIAEVGTWRSRVAKAIHPTGTKPCKVCGRVLEIRYVYPNKLLIGRIKKLSYYDAEFAFEPHERITDLIARLVGYFGDRIYDDFPRLLSCNDIPMPGIPRALAAWTAWANEQYIPLEPRTLSPGVMANPPDRLDGFHSFNNCCRSSADTGRTSENLLSYTTDRRCFEHWVDGNWVAADRLMGQVKSSMQDIACYYGHSGPCSPDHIGPISLGFAHRPEFRFLCRSCNSGKNNRMRLCDVEHLRRVEAQGTVVTSWYCAALWDLRKNDVHSDENAERLSKLLRDNRDVVMSLLGRFAEAGHLTFLTTFLELRHADCGPCFNGLRAEDHITTYDRMTVSPRTTLYALEQKKRRLRIAFQSLRDYLQKEQRHLHAFSDSEFEVIVNETLAVLADPSASIRELDTALGTALARSDDGSSEWAALIGGLPSAEVEPPSFTEARNKLRAAMEIVAAHLSSNWTADRYVRSMD